MTDRTTASNTTADAPMRYLVAIPCMSTVPTGFLTSMLGLQHVGQTHIVTSEGSLVYDSRNRLAAVAINDGEHYEYDRVLFIDSDMTFQPDMMIRLAQDMDGGCEMVNALCFMRKSPTEPVIYKAIRRDLDGNITGVDTYTDYPRNELFEVAGCGFAATMITTDLLRRVWELYGPPFNPLAGMGEDLSFCRRAALVGARIWCDSRVRCGHIGQTVFDESTWDRQIYKTTNQTQQTVNGSAKEAGQ